MSDLIDRQALLEKKIRIPIARIVTEDKTIYRDVVFVKDIESFPSAEPERKTGKWIKEREEWFTDYPYKCTNCGKYSRARYHFCPNCGADMREGEQE